MADQLISQGAKVIADDDTLELSGTNVMSIKALGVDTPELAAGAVTAAKTDGLSSIVLDTTLGATATDISITGLDLETDGHYRIVLNVVGSASSTAVSMFMNADTTSTNYNRITITSDGTTVSTLTSNDSNVCDAANNQNHLIVIDIVKTSGERPLATILTSRRTNADIDIRSWEWANTTNVTTILFRNSGASGFEADTRIQVFKVT